MNYKRLTLLVTVILAIVVIFATYKVVVLDLFPWLNVLISSALSLIAFVLSFLVKGKNRIIQLALLAFFILQLILNYTILQNPEILLKNWRYLFYPISILIYILLISASLKKEKKFFLVGISAFSGLFFVLSIFSPNSIWLTLQLLFFVLFSIVLVASKNIHKPKSIESNFK